MRLAVLVMAAIVTAAPASAQRLTSGSVTTGVQFQGYDFDDALGVEAVNLMLVPAAYQVGVGQRLGFDVYTAYARGAALIGGTEYTLSGLVDTRLRANYSVGDWGMLTFGVNVPTGKSGHTEDEARVAAVLSSDLLGFREATFGLGFGATTGIATAYRVGATGIGIGVSYRYASEFEPRADTTLKYTPGNEMRVRVGLDRTVAGNKLTAGITYQNFATDQLDGRDLFQAGNRWRGDATYSFRTGPSAVWTAYVTDIWRDHGDIRFDAIDNEGGTEPTTTRTGTQNLLIAGVSGSLRINAGLNVLPLVEVRTLSREDEGGEGWLGAAGVSVPLRLGQFGVTPGGRVSFGAMQGAEPVNRSVLGGELNLTVGWGGR